MITLTYLKFYSDIGGWGYALEQTCCSIQVAAISAATAIASPIAAEPMLHPIKQKFANSNAIGKDRSHAHLEPIMKLCTKLLIALDQSNLCNSVFYHSRILPNCFPTIQPPILLQTIQAVQAKPNSQLKAYSATIWCMSPHVNLIVETSLIY